MTRNRFLAFCLSAALLVPAAASADPWNDESGKGRDRHEAADRGDWDRGDDRRRDRDGFSAQDDRRGDWNWRPGDPIPPFAPAQGRRADIPPGHLPPPGECRVWDSNRPPGHQAPPFPC